MNGVAHISVHAQDSAGASVDNFFTVTVDSVDDTPVAADDTATMNEDAGTLTIDVLANDTHGDDPTTIISAGVTVTIAGVPYPNSSESTPTTVLDATGTSVTLPNGSLVINGNNIEYTPKQDFNGTDHFTYTIQDADGETSTATVTVVVNPVNDAPVQASTVTYTVVQGSFIDILAAGGIASHGFDADTDTISVIQETAPTSTGTGYSGTTLSLQPDGGFLYIPDVTFVGTDSFSIRLYDGVTTSGVINVVVQVTAAPPPPPPPPAGEVEFNFNLAKVPLEDAISSEANVLVIMDDSGSMDWAVMTDGAEGEFWLTNAGIKDNRVGTATTAYQYLTPLSTNVYGNTTVLPTEARVVGRCGVQHQQLRCVARSELAIQHRVLQPAGALCTVGRSEPQQRRLPERAADRGAARSVRRRDSNDQPDEHDHVCLEQRADREGKCGIDEEPDQQQRLHSALLHDDGYRTPGLECGAHAGGDQQYAEHRHERRGPQSGDDVPGRCEPNRLRESVAVYVRGGDPELRELVYLLPQPRVHGEGGVGSNGFGRDEHPSRLRRAQRCQRAVADRFDERVVPRRKQEDDDESDLQGRFEQRHAVARRARQGGQVLRV